MSNSSSVLLLPPPPTWKKNINISIYSASSTDTWVFFWPAFRPRTTSFLGVRQQQIFFSASISSFESNFFGDNRSDRECKQAKQSLGPTHPGRQATWGSPTLVAGFGETELIVGMLLGQLLRGKKFRQGLTSVNPYLYLIQISYTYTTCLARSASIRNDVCHFLWPDRTVIHCCPNRKHNRLLLLL